jgi:uncharacterized protein YjbI with pentapeptide repeats
LNNISQITHHLPHEGAAFGEDGRNGARLMNDPLPHSASPHSASPHSASPDSASPYSRRDLLADCQNCFGICCVALPFAASADFAIDKAAGEPCIHLHEDFRCGIHGRLRKEGFAGCTVYDCFGAGQQVSQVTFGGRDWRRAPKAALQMFQVFPIMRALHELLWYLNEALTLVPAASLRPAIRAALDETGRLTSGDPESLLGLNLARHRQGVGALLLETSRLVRATARRDPNARRSDFSRADLVGAKFPGVDLRGADFRGSHLIGADLRGADLRLADMIGADLRAADLSGADLVDSIFLTQFQVNAAKGDAATKLPAALSRPSHWTATASAGS